MKIDANALRYNGETVVDLDGKTWVKVAAYGGGVFGVIEVDAESGTQMYVIQTTPKAKPPKRTKKKAEATPPASKPNPFL